MKRHSFIQLVLDLRRGGRPLPLSQAPDGLLQALADLLLEASGSQNKAVPTRREGCDASQDHT